MKKKPKDNAFNTVTTFSKICALVMFVMFPVIAFYLGVWYQTKIDEPLINSNYTVIKPVTPPKACSMEAKLCPDGKTYVGRHRPSCEFAACPVEK